VKELETYHDLWSVWINSNIISCRTMPGEATVCRTYWVSGKFLLHMFCCNASGINTTARIAKKYNGFANIWIDLHFCWNRNLQFISGLRQTTPPAQHVVNDVIVSWVMWFFQLVPQAYDIPLCSLVVLSLCAKCSNAWHSVIVLI
jgi:hypothetical protein